MRCQRSRYLESSGRRTLPLQFRHNLWKDQHAQMVALTLSIIHMQAAGNLQCPQIFFGPTLDCIDKTLIRSSEHKSRNFHSQQVCLPPGTRQIPMSPSTFHAELDPIGLSTAAKVLDPGDSEQTGKLSLRVERVRRFLSFCLAIDYLVSTDTPDKLSEEDLHHFTDLGLYCFRSASDGTPPLVRGSCIGYLQPRELPIRDTRLKIELFRPCVALGVPCTAAISMLRTFIASLRLWQAGYESQIDSLVRETSLDNPFRQNHHGQENCDSGRSTGFRVPPAIGRSSPSRATKVVQITSRTGGLRRQRLWRAR